ncbi:hypothetical protein BD408DRAFT_427305, partial [Parasitella parasitica]
MVKLKHRLKYARLCLLLKLLSVIYMVNCYCRGLSLWISINFLFTWNASFCLVSLYTIGLSFDSIFIFIYFFFI